MRVVRCADNGKKIVPKHLHALWPTNKVRVHEIIRPTLHGPEETKERDELQGWYEILLALSVATDDMIRHVAMFPEVFYLDITANTNSLK